MDPITHLAAGVIISQSIAPFPENLVPLAGAIIASQLPDLDFLTKKIGSSTLFLRLHHKIGHSLLILVPLGALLTAGLVMMSGYERWFILFSVIVLTLLSHLFLDILVHSAGISLFWPLHDRKDSLSLIMGANPLTTSARCAERSLIVCLRCQLHGSLYITTFYLLSAGALLTLLLPSQSRLIVVSLFLIYALYTVYTVLQKRRARALWVQEVSGQGYDRFEVVPGGYQPWLWFGLASAPDRFHTAYINTRQEQIFFRQDHKNSADLEPISLSKTTETVRNFLEEAMFPHVTTSRNGGRIEVKWRELSYAFSPDVELYTARVLITEEGTILSHEFRERWD